MFYNYPNSHIDLHGLFTSSSTPEASPPLWQLRFILTSPLICPTPTRFEENPINLSSFGSTPMCRRCLCFYMRVKL
ncbi:hypothetical protein CsatA_009030 [Cannabis sativa]